MSTCHKLLSYRCRGESGANEAVLDEHETDKIDRIPRMASGAILSSLRRRRSPTLEAFLAPVDLSDVALVHPRGDCERDCFVFLQALFLLPAQELAISDLKSGGFPPPFGVFERFRLREASPPNDEAGAIPYLRNLLSSPNVVAQENSVTALLNLSIFDKNKSRIMDENGCLGSIVDVLRFGHTTVAALVGALGNEGVAEEAAGALALIV
ncbi:hypothetical protein Fmac_031167 [Flemingia macrophylla]|uniref:Uncharacterized protein n=1 Tax=Flemingia macrophylla TaxID=520843 RepID=A0ABD1L1B7_9FABA